MDEVMDYFAIAQITPGIIAVNVATFAGYKRKGIAGGIIATIGLIIPGAALMIIISVFFDRFADYEIIQHAFTGIRLAVCALILDTIVKLRKSVTQNYKSAVIFVCVFILSAAFSPSPVLIIIGGALAGLVFFRPDIRLKKKENKEKESGN